MAAVGLTGSQAEYARHLGVSRQTVSKRAAKGRLVMTPEGLVDFRASDALFAEVRDPSRGGPVSEGRQAEEAARPSAPEQQPRHGFADARARREAAQAETAELQLARMRGELVARDGVEDAMGEAGRAVRRVMDGLTMRAEELDAAARQGGVPAVRALLRRMVRETQMQAAAALRQAASAAMTENEQPDEGDDGYYDDDDDDDGFTDAPTSASAEARVSAGVLPLV